MRAFGSIVIFFTLVVSYVVIACELVGSVTLNLVGMQRLDGGMRRTLVGAALLAALIALAVTLALVYF